jgi:hypothetical protein
MPPSPGFIGTWDPAGGGSGSATLQDIVDNGNSVEMPVNKIFEINHDLTEPYPRSLFSSDQLPLVMLDDGMYLGATKLAENNYYLDNVGRFWIEPSDVIIDGDYFLGVAISADGRIMFAAERGSGTWRSIDYGRSWTKVFNGGDSWGMATSANGKHVVRSEYGGGIYVSHDYGLGWPNPLLSPATVPGVPARYWRAFAVSTDGRYMIGMYGNAGVNGVWQSEDFGDSWTFNNVDCENHSDVIMSSDGKIRILGSYVDKSYISYDYGVTWEIVPGVPGSIVAWNASFGMSANGRHIVAARQSVGSSIYISHDYGQTWGVSYAPSQSWARLNMSSDGMIILASVSAAGGLLYLSMDGGVTWGTIGAPMSRGMVKMSASGNSILLAYNIGVVGHIEFSRADTIVNATNLLIPACPSEILDADMPESSYIAWIDEGTDMLEFKVKYSDGTVKSVSIGPLV